MNTTTYRSEVLIIGSGLSGCTTALTLADQGHKVHIVCPKGEISELEPGNSTLAQGGIVYVHNNPQEEKALEDDMLVAGHNYNFVQAVRFLAQEGGESVHKILIERLGVPFNLRSSNTADWDLTLEGGHSAPRILHCADFTGKSIMDALHRVITTHENITVLSNRLAIDLITTDHHTTLVDYRYRLKNQCVGAYVFNEISDEVEKHLSEITILATGGVASVYLHSTNNSWSVGSGICMAKRAGVRLANMEFVQFHPTTLYGIEKQRPLITEAVRGEGGILVDENGDAFMQKYDPRKDLAPRDVVSQAIITQMLTTGSPNVFLDATELECEDVTKRFPTVFESCMKLGIDIRRDHIPVVPAAHYFCGGILVDLNGRSTLDNLYAVGECSCTGIHGANRLASTSLLEAVLWGLSAGNDIAKVLKTAPCISERLFGSIPDWEHTGNERNDDPALIAQDWASIHNTMWNYVGILRTEGRLRRAFADLRDLSSHLHDFYRYTPLSMPLLKLFHGCETAYLITQSALRNKNSVGCHHREK